MVLTSLTLTAIQPSNTARKPFQTAGLGVQPHFGSTPEANDNPGDRVDFNSPGNTGSLGSISLVFKNGLLDLKDLPGIAELNLGNPPDPTPEPAPWPMPLRMVQQVGHALHYCLVRPLVGTNKVTMEHPLVDNEAFNVARVKWDTKVKPAVEALNRIPLAQFFPFALDRYQFFKIPPDYVGIPPSVEIPRFDNTPPSKNTHGVLASLALSILSMLPAGNTMEDTLAQLYTSFWEITRQSGMNTPPFTKEPGLDHSGGMRASGPGVLTLSNLYSSLQTSHMVFIAPNGALQIVARPNAQVMSEILAHDPVAQKHLDKQKPLNQNAREGLDALTDKTYDAATTIAYLKTLTDGRARQSANGWTDVHTVLRNIPIDFARHIADKRLRILLEKPGADGQGVWDYVRNNPVPPQPKG